MTVVIVTWNDAEDPSEGKTWLDDEDLAQFAQHDCLVRSVGFVKSHTEKYLTLVGDEIPELNHYGRSTKIPVGMIQTIDIIKE